MADGATSCAIGLAIGDNGFYFVSDVFGTNLLGAPGVGHSFGFPILVSSEAGLS